MERGFKSRCEAMARSLRIEMGLEVTAPLSVEMIADYLNVSIWSVLDIGLSESDLYQLVTVDPDSWSAVTVSIAGRDVVIVNPNHRGGRYSSDVMHELAHLLLGHEPSKMVFTADADLALRGYDPSAEEEANWLAAALLLPRDALVRIRSSHMPDQSVCDQYQVSKRLLTFRMNATGVARQFGRTRPSI